MFSCWLAWLQAVRAGPAVPRRTLGAGVTGDKVQFGFQQGAGSLFLGWSFRRCLGSSDSGVDQCFVCLRMQWAFLPMAKLVLWNWTQIPEKYCGKNRWGKHTIPAAPAQLERDRKRIPGARSWLATWSSTNPSARDVEPFGCCLVPAGRSSHSLIWNGCLIFIYIFLKPLWVVYCVCVLAVGACHWLHSFCNSQNCTINSSHWKFQIFFFVFLQMDLIWRYFKTPFKLLNLDIIVTT